MWVTGYHRAQTGRGEAAQVRRQVQQSLWPKPAGHHNLDGSRRVVSGRKRIISHYDWLHARRCGWPHGFGDEVLGSTISAYRPAPAVARGPTRDGPPYAIQDLDGRDSGSRTILGRNRG